MPNPQLLEYIRQRKALGATESVIRDELKKSGWQDSSIAEAFKGGPLISSNTVQQIQSGRPGLKSNYFLLKLTIGILTLAAFGYGALMAFGVFTTTTALDNAAVQQVLTTNNQGESNSNDNPIPQSTTVPAQTSTPLSAGEVAAFAYVERLIDFYNKHIPAGDQDLAQIGTLIGQVLSGARTRDSRGMHGALSTAQKIVVAIAQQYQVDLKKNSSVNSNDPVSYGKSLCATQLSSGIVPTECLNTRLMPAYLGYHIGQLIDMAYIAPKFGIIAPTPTADGIVSTATYRYGLIVEYARPSTLIAGSMAGLDVVILTEQLTKASKSLDKQAQTFNMKTYWATMNTLLDTIVAK